MRRIGLMVLLALNLAPALEARPRLRVMTYNIHFGAGPRAAQIAPGAGWVDQVAAMIKLQNPDVVALQEVVAGGLRAAFVNQRTRLEEKTGYRIYYKEALTSWGSSSGIALLTRHPVIDQRVVEIMKAGNYPAPADQPDRAERRIAQAARVAVPGWEPVWFVNTHYHAGRAENRIPNFDAMQERLIGTLGGPVVVMGDLNSRAGNAEITHGKQVLRTAEGDWFMDALEACGKPNPRTYMNTADHFRLDWLLVSSRHFVVENAFVTGWELSDHEAIVATLRAADDVPAVAGGAPVNPTAAGSAPGRFMLLGIR